MSEEANFISNPTVWYAAAIAIFFAGAYKYARKPILNVIDSEIEKIRSELEEAKKLRAEAAATLEEYRARQKEAQAEAESIISQARKEANRLREAAAAEIKASLKRHEQKAAERIKLAEEEAIVEVRNMVIDEAVAIAKKTLAEKLDPSTAKSLIDRAILESSGFVSEKSKTVQTQKL